MILAVCLNPAIDVTYRVEDPRIRSVSFRISAIDEEFAGWIRDAYDQVGCGRR